LGCCRQNSSCCGSHEDYGPGHRLECCGDGLKCCLSENILFGTCCNANEKCCNNETFANCCPLNQTCTSHVQCEVPRGSPMWIIMVSSTTGGFVAVSVSVGIIILWKRRRKVEYVHFTELPTSTSPAFPKTVIVHAPANPKE